MGFLPAKCLKFGLDSDGNSVCLPPSPDKPDAAFLKSSKLFHLLCVASGESSQEALGERWQNVDDDWGNTFNGSIRFATSSRGASPKDFPQV